MEIFRSKQNSFRTLNFDSSFVKAYFLWEVLKNKTVIAEEAESSADGLIYSKSTLM